ncbi:hypothetical protein GIY23_06320 [Allosaccharopolyspora coralli]|uniref:WXG100 family type VII secretion target n=1 Tax=Allosaccharopolyspora coralli TaxID=2665642 RepID=A0A5Q3QEH0_9PSEU|nr:hypothetical protein [Allosaccharopolyspora coralli]QGK69197.1 hypothetical protein GIY23_06320 [Allosaccharopolyspora coralli]
MNDLVAKAQDDGKSFTGAGPLDGIEDIGNNVDNVFEEGKKIDPVQLGIDGAGLALDTAGAVVDPLGTLASSAVGWIIENVGWIREPFDDLMGDPPAIEAVAATYENISQRLQEIADQHKGSLSQVKDWQEQSGAAYRGEAAQLYEHVSNGAAGAASAANKIKTAGALVAATRALIRDVLAEMAGTLIVWGLGALASSVPTAGASVAAFIARAVAKGAEVAGRIAQFLKKLFKALDDLGGLAKSSSDALRKRADDLADISRQRPDVGLGGRLKMREQHMEADFRAKADGRDALGDKLQGDGLEARNQKLDDFTDRMNDKAATKRDEAAAHDRSAAENWQESARDRWAGRDHAGAGWDRLTTSADQTSNGPLSDSTVGKAAEWVDSKLGKTATDGQNWIRSVMSGDLGHVKPEAPWVGDVVPGAKEGAKEFNKAFTQDDDEKPYDETPRP